MCRECGVVRGRPGRRRPPGRRVTDPWYPAPASRRAPAAARLATPRTGRAADLSVMRQKADDRGMSGMSFRNSGSSLTVVDSWRFARSLARSARTVVVTCGDRRLLTG
jgi:hypothetical protein